RQLAEAGHLLEKARDELMVTGANAVLAAASSKAKALGGFTSPQRAAYRAFEDAKAYEAFVLKRRESRAITSCLREAHPMLLTTPAR
ncbi:DNA primase, partial [Escherichia coli]|nr:DNA primase [Escherichia coli]